MGKDLLTLFVGKTVHHFSCPYFYDPQHEFTALHTLRPGAHFAGNPLRFSVIPPVIEGFCQQFTASQAHRLGTHLAGNSFMFNFISPQIEESRQDGTRAVADPLAFCACEAFLANLCQGRCSSPCQEKSSLLATFDVQLGIFHKGINA